MSPVAIVACVCLAVTLTRISPSEAIFPTPELQNVFLGRCKDYEITRYLTILPRVKSDCRALWTNFFKAFSFKAPCNLDLGSYKDFFQRAQQTLPKNKVMFWSGVYDEAHDFADDGRKYITLEDTLPGYMLNSLVWCGQRDKPGFNQKVCPDFKDCPVQARESFWGTASSSYAHSAEGDVTYMVDGSNPKVPAYRPDSFFGKYELPNLTNKVTKVKVIVLHQLGQKIIERCGAGSLLDLEMVVKAKKFGFDCVENPKSVLFLLCADNPNARECQLAKRYYRIA
uniref:ADP-ribosyl cyclase/cyclic ADP-ribose hydrolase n=1 Tax=Aplysia kurodai TaxID=6501 RepID=NADA_APLKU|nr:RecName: Full=ADP-ribosyl cyclase/cyclic ADP-ribose hydrolase; AltName: Full=2'-phospho-ADP-ribosyl cyclase; AltName: Full=2'-phospho-ADP-ribosyl cyclase/2'-phospho-cyclic-ADP-ribose transferase; AltName: Full=2'-phospho-cyclic-ADP-ribose transferase; AltName: Full=ADP-ribosyl cyclase; Short=ADPRC; Short=ADRC; AltName: Full=NAD glycohydrolase; AltName: Full=NAD(+) nucleosidase; Short=NADase; Flags: Precursor [Aplysia kurodai]BAA06284.1 ADP-ribosyl cyclase precursor [Aplysia kurodai]BAA07537.1 